MRLVRAFAELKFDALGVDVKGNRHVPKAKWICLDLTTPFGLDKLKELIASGAVAFVWFGIPCGTASRARDIPWKGHEHVRALRTDSEPWGRIDIELTEVERIKLQKSNAVYTVALGLVALCNSMGVLWAI